jgi:hypothetical protein
MNRAHWILAAIALSLLVLIPRARNLSAANEEAPCAETLTWDGAVQLAFGLHATAARQWEGSFSATKGEVAALWGWHFLAPDRVFDGNHFSFQARLFNDPSARYKGQDKLPSPVLPNGVFAGVRATPEATFRVATNHGNFEFRWADLKASGRLTFLDGDAAVTYTAPVEHLTCGAASQHDFPSAAALAGDLYVAWDTYHNEANLVYLAVRRQGKWQVERATSRWGNYYGTAVAADGRGGVHVVWSEYANDRWQLMSRAFTPATGQWSAAEPVAPRGRRQMFHKMTTDASGRPWIVWQEFANGNFDIFAASHSAQGWSQPLRISNSEANDWDPAIAAAPDGRVWIAWDSYDRGNYDIFMRAIRGGKLEPLVQVTAAPTYDAHPSLAVDPANRVWLAWEEGGADWGKDNGVLGKPGASLLASRAIRLVRYADGRFSEPSAPLADSVPAWLSSMQQFPTVAIGANGLPYVFFRHYLHRLPETADEVDIRAGGLAAKVAPWHEVPRAVWDTFVAGFDGAHWLPACELAESGGRSATQSATVMAAGKLVHLWSSDGRSYIKPRVASAQLRFVELETADAPAAIAKLQPFVSIAGTSAGAAPTEKQDLARVHAERWEAASPGRPEPLRLLRGDLHRHTDISADSQWDGDIVDTFRYATDAAALDFLAVTDHTGHELLNYFHYDWWRTRQVTTLFNNPGKFVALFGYERTVPYPGGHRNVISTRADMQPFRIADEENTGLESYGDRLFPYMKQHGEFAIPHTTATGAGTTWRENDAVAEPVTEIFQGLRGAYEAKDGINKGVGMSQPDGLVSTAWTKGLHIGVIASSDHYSTHQSYACVYAAQFTPESIHDAMKRRSTFAATDNIVIRFEAISRDGKTYSMGQEFEATDPPELHAVLKGTAPLVKVELVANGRVVLARQPGSANDEFRYRATSLPEEKLWYYVRGVQGNGQLVWSSPIWVHRK